MIYVICGVRDRALDAFGVPWFVQSTGQATRGFADAINAKDGKHDNMSAHPEDFDLYHLGEYSDANAVFTLLPHPRLIAVGKDCVISK